MAGAQPKNRPGSSEPSISAIYPRGKPLHQHALLVALIPAVVSAWWGEEMVSSAGHNTFPAKVGWRAHNPTRMRAMHPSTSESEVRSMVYDVVLRSPETGYCMGEVVWPLHMHSILVVNLGALIRDSVVFENDPLKGPRLLDGGRQRYGANVRDFVSAEVYVLE